MAVRLIIGEPPIVAVYTHLTITVVTVEGAARFVYRNEVVVNAQPVALGVPIREKWVHFFGPVSGKTKVDSFIGYAAHLGLIRGGTPSGLYC